MSGLREVLEEYAGTVPEVTPSTRVQEVRGRIAAARRRRTAVAVAGAVVVVAAGALAVTLPRNHTATPSHAPAKLVGHQVPRTMTSLGSTYRYVRGYVGRHGRLSVNLPPSATGYLVRMVAADDWSQLELGWRGAPDQWGTAGVGFGPFYEVPVGAPRHLLVREPGTKGGGKVALAVYQRASTAPGSVDKAGIDFPPDVAGQPLLAAWVGNPGQGAHTFHLSGTEGRIDIRESCANLPRGSMLKVAISGQKGYITAGNGCTGAVPEPRPGEYGDVSSLRVSRGPHDVTVSVVGHDEKPLAVPPSARLGVGIYNSSLLNSVHGLPRFVDTAGHRWKLARTDLAPVGKRQMTAMPTGSGPVLVTFGSVGGLQGRVTAQILPDGAWAPTETDGLTAGGTSSRILPGIGLQRIALEARGTSSATRLVVATYELAD